MRGGEIVSADSRQVYREMDVGTAKPTRGERARVRHHLIDVADPGERYDVSRYQKEARAALDDVNARGKLAVVVGGTGLYVRALAEGLFREPPFDQARRDQLRQWAEALDARDLTRWAGRLDEAFPGGGRQRAARAIEVALLTGHALSWWQREARDSGTLHPWYIHLTVPREVLHRRLAARVDDMLRTGLVEEVQRARAAGTAPNAPGLDGIGYREVVAMLSGDLAESAVRDAILVSTRRYAKRQDTWFRNQLREPGVGSREPEVWTLDATESAEVLARRIHERWSSLTPGSRLPVPR